MYDEIEIREIVFEAQRKIDKLFTGLKVVVVEDERKVTRADVVKALQDRQRLGMGASNDIDSAPTSLDRMLCSSPKWTTSSDDKRTRSTANDVIEQKKPEKKSLFRRLYERALSTFKSSVGAPIKEQKIAADFKHKNKVPCRVFKDGKAL